jgi:Domain of unknown function (DUF4917)
LPEVSLATAAPTFNLLTFQQCLQQADGRKHVLLGNGFSRALRNDIFAYDALFLRADFSRLSPTARQAFTVLNTTDFEVVMRALRLMAQLIPLYRDDPDLVRTLTADADGLREVLVEAIAQNHPEGPWEVTEHQYAACRRFLANFDTIYTLNYDLLLYWALMHSEIEPALEGDDGFRTPEDDQADYVTWEVEKTDGQTIFYLHGALHIFDAETELKKYTWIRTGVRLIEQIRNALQANLYPLIVAEGQSQEKMAKILHSMYLSREYRSFAKIQHNLFIYGLSFGENDQHWFDLIRRGRIRAVFVSLYGDPNSETNLQIRTRVNQISTERGVRRPLEVHFFDAASAQVWG